MIRRRSSSRGCFPAGQIGLFIAAPDGSDERPLLAPADIDYDPVWSPDGASIVFTSERDGSADLYRVKPDGSGLERLTDSPAYDDQAAFSPDGKQLVFVSTRSGGTADLWTMDLQTRRAKPLTSGAGGDFRPSWSPDGKWIAFSSDRGSTLPFAHGRWEHLQLVDLYIVHPDGIGPEAHHRARQLLRQPEVVRRQPARDRLLHDGRADARRTAARVPEPRNDTRLVSIDVATGATTDVPAGPGREVQPVVPAGDDDRLHPQGRGEDAGIYYANGKRGPKGDVRTAAWSPDGTRVVFHKRLTASADAVGEDVQPESRVRADADRDAAVVQPGRRSLRDRRPPARNAYSARASALPTPAATTSTSSTRTRRATSSAPQWSPRGDSIIFGIGVFNAFFNGFHGLFLKPGDRVEGGAQIAMINPDGSGFREVTTRSEQQRLSVDGARRQALRLPLVRPRRRRAADHEPRDQDGHDARDGLRQLPAVVAARRSDHVLAPGRRATTRSTRSSRTAPASKRLDAQRTATTRTWRGRPTASTSCSRRRAWDSRTK